MYFEENVFLNNLTAFCNSLEGQVYRAEVSAGPLELLSLGLPSKGGMILPLYSSTDKHDFDFILGASGIQLLRKAATRCLWGDHGLEDCCMRF